MPNNTRLRSTPSLLPNTALLICAIGMLAGGSASAKEIRVESPDRNIVVTVDAPEGGQLTYRVRRKGQTAVETSPLGIIVDNRNLGEKVSLGQPTLRVVQEEYPTRGVHTTARSHYREALLPVSSAGASPAPWTLEVRVFNDGMAYRYRVPGQGTRQIGGEASVWKLPAGTTLWYQSNKNKDYEAPYQKGTTAELAAGTTLAAPATAKLPGNLGYAMITEANLIGYSDMALEVTTPGTFKALFHNDSQGWSASGEVVSPWRVTVLTPDLNTLVNTDILPNLCPPPAPEVANAAWIQPGRTAWHWMVTGRPKLEEQRQWVDWTQQLGFEYYLVDDGWKDWKAEGKDAWACLTDLVTYAKTKNVRIFAWVNSAELRTESDRTAYLQKAKAAGVVGLKIDFPRPANSEWVQWYDDMLAHMARYQLMVDFHGAVKPTGRERTWPHELTREGIRGRENGKQTPLHDAALPFVRLVQGHADFTPTEWNPRKLGNSTWAHELAQAIVYTSPLLCYCGSPADYLSNPAVDIIKSIPSTWDETIVLPGSEVGELAGYARRKGNDWYIGVLNGEAERTLPIRLNFLGKGTYQVEQFADSAERKDGWNQSKATVTGKSTLSAALRSGGGFVAKLTRVK